MTVKRKRIYLPVEESDGYRILVDRLWPRGIKKEDSRIDLWYKDVAPSNELRRWFGHDPAKYAGFIERYRQELTDAGTLETLRRLIRDKPSVTLLYAAKDEEHNNAAVLMSLL